MEEFINYILITNNIKLEILENSNIKEIVNYTKKTLNHVNNKSYDLIIARKRREEIRNDIDDLERAYVNADNLEINEQGKNTGGKVNHVELRKLKILELKEKLGKLTEETFLLEKSLIKNKQIVSKAFDEILKEDNATVMKLYYIDCFNASKIAIELYYTRDTVRQKRRRSINDIAKEIKKYTQKK